jgi:phosphate transport system substrate-binding protein
VSFPEVGGNEETRNQVASTRGALSQLSSSWADGQKVFALGIKLDGGTVVLPTNENIAARKYPMTRPLFLLTSGEPTDDRAGLVPAGVTWMGARLRRRKEAHAPLG